MMFMFFALRIVTQLCNVRNRLKALTEDCAFHLFPLHNYIYDTSLNSSRKERSFKQKLQRKSEHAFHIKYIFSKMSLLIND